MVRMNTKTLGDIGQNCVIGHLARYGIGTAVVISDNYPFDFIAIAETKLFKVQVKTSSQHQGCSVIFPLNTNNWRQSTSQSYSGEDCDVIACYDITTDTVFLLKPMDFEGKKTFNIRLEASKNNQQANAHKSDDFVLSPQRIKDVFGIEPVDLNASFTDPIVPTQYNHKCEVCGKEFVNSSKNCKRCSNKCYGISQRRVERPNKDQLEEEIKNMSWLSLGQKYNVSDNAVRKWAKQYGLI